MKKLLSFMTASLLFAEICNSLSAAAVIEADFPADVTKRSVVVEITEPSGHKRLKQSHVTRDPIVRANCRLLIEDPMDDKTKVTLFVNPNINEAVNQHFYVQGVVWLTENPTGTLTGTKDMPWKASFGWDLSNPNDVQERKFEMLAINLIQVNLDIGGHHALIKLF